MADTLPARSTKRKTRAAPPARRPGATVSQQILEAVAATKERRGVSMPALKKVLSGRGYDVARNNWRVNQAVRSLVTKGSLLQATGTGASGSFRLSKTWGDREEEEKKKKPKREPAAAARERRRRRMKQRAARKPARKAAPRSRGSPRKTKKHGAARKGARRATARKPKGRKAARAGGKGKRQRAKPRKLAKQPEQEADQTPAQEETSLSEKESQVCSEQEDSS